MRQIKVLMIGESLIKQGGIVSVQKLILDGMPSSVEFEHLATVVDGSSFKKISLFAGALVKLCWTLLSQDIDLIHTHVSERGSAFRQAITTLIALLFRKPLIIHTHGSEFHIFYEKLPRAMQKTLNFIYGRSTYLIALSERWRTFYIQSLELRPEKVVVLPNAVKVPEKIPHRDHFGIVSLVFLGRIGQRKGTFDLVKAFADLSPEIQTQATLTIAGDGEGSQLKSLISSLDLAKYISVINWLDAEQRDVLLEKSDIFILPSYNEGLPMALLEAMSWGLPVITTPVGGIPELVHSEENGLLVQPGDLVKLAAAMQRLIENKEFRLTLGKAARKSILPFDVKPYCSSLVDIYYSSLKSS